MGVRLSALVLVAASLPGMSGAASAAGAGDAVSSSHGPVPAVQALPIDAPADYQLGGAYPLPTGVRVVARDHRESPAGDFAICYVNAFQTQPEQRRWWRARHPDLLLRRRGRAVTDPGWRGEVLLDTRTPERRRALARIVGRWIDGCAAAGFDAVEPDNLDSWTRSRGLLRRSDAVAYSRLLVARAHRVGLALAQKNAASLLGARKRVGWDFVVAEECQVYRECGRFERAYGTAMIEIEYVDAGGRRGFQSACAARGQRIAVVYRDRDLLPAGRRGHVFDTC